MSPNTIQVPRLTPPGRGAAARYAVELLTGLGFAAGEDDRGALDLHPDEAWAGSGAMHLTGAPDGPAQRAPAPIASCADGALRALCTLASATTGSAPQGLDGAALLGERAALSAPALTRGGRVSPGGSARLIAGADGWLALNLAREDDRELVPAWLEVPPPAGDDPDETWKLVEERVRVAPVDSLVARGRLIGLALSGVPRTPPRPRPNWVESTRLCAPRPASASPLVVDLSALWAGPLCGSLLAACSARVVKVESRERPDGARGGDPRFFDLLNAEKQSVALPFREPDGVRALGELLAAADIVIEASRPRALEQLGLFADSFVAEHGTTWLSITGHGRSRPERDWVAFGDDAAVSGGLVVQTADGSPAFCGDAIADPLTGVHAALAALAAHAKGGGRRVDLSLAGVAAWVRGQPTPVPGRESRSRPSAALPRARTVAQHAPELGADTASVLGELDERSGRC